VPFGHRLRVAAPSLADPVGLRPPSRRGRGPTRRAAPARMAAIFAKRNARFSSNRINALRSGIGADHLSGRKHRRHDACPAAQRHMHAAFERGHGGPDHSLFRRKNSLLRQRKFPVTARQEIGRLVRKPVKLLRNPRSASAPAARFLQKLPVNFPVSWEFAHRRARQRTRQRPSPSPLTSPSGRRAPSGFRPRCRPAPWAPLRRGRGPSRWAGRRGRCAGRTLPRG
jgi:hypothetical protein